MTEILARTAEPPLYDEDLFSEGALREPYGHYRRIRDLGPVVRLHRPDVYALGRFADVKTALRSPDALISSKGVGFNDIVNAPKSFPPMIESDGDRHKRMRMLLNESLLPGAIAQHRQLMADMLDECVASLVGGDWFDAVPVLARRLPIELVSILVGLPDMNRANMLRWAAAGFNTTGPIDSSGPAADQLRADFASLAEVREYLAVVPPEDLRAGSWTDNLFKAAAEGSISEQEARATMSGFVLPSLDTTISATACLLRDLADHPDQWRKLREDPGLASSAVLEGMRYSAVVRWFSRVAVRDHVVEDVVIPAGARVMLMYQSANRDERRYENADAFDIARNPLDQLGWGAGPHMCGGMHLAKMEMETILQALARHVDRIEIGEPVLGTNRGLYGLERLPMRLHR